MKKILTIFVLVLAITLISGCGKKNGEINNVNAERVNSDDSQMEEFSATMEELAEKGKPYECTYDIKTEQLTQTGKIYFADKKMRGDIDIQMEEMPPNTMHFIKNGNNQYVWNDGSTDGFLMTISEEEQEDMQKQAQENTSEQNQIDYNSQINFKCKKWNTNNTLFTPPTNIKFEDFTALMNNFGNGLGADTENMETIDRCAICNMIPAGEAKDACSKENCN